MTDQSSATIVGGDFRVTSREQLRQLYKAPREAAVLKQIDRLDTYCRSLVAASPFFVLATGSAGGLDCSPKGDKPGFVKVLDDQTLLIPDRPGNNRIDGLLNIVEDARVGLIFLIPGLDEAFRVSGLASISVDPSLLALFADDDKPPKSVIVVAVTEAFLHCGRAMHTADLWNPGTYVQKDELPNVTEVFQAHVAYSREKASTS